MADSTAEPRRPRPCVIGDPRPCGIAARRAPRAAFSAQSAPPGQLHAAPSMSSGLRSSAVELTCRQHRFPVDDAGRAEYDVEVESLEEVRDRPWRERVVARSLGPAIRQSIFQAQAAIRATVELLEAGRPVTVQDVADSAGLSPGVIHRHFSSTEDLLGAVLEDCMETSAERLRAELAGVADPVERIAEFLRRTLDIEAKPLNVALQRQETALLLTHPAEVNRAWAPLAALGCELIEQAVAAGRIEPKNADHGAYALLAVGRAYHHARLLGDDLGLPLPSARQLVDQCLRSLGITS
jgi:AcrR family transcriptional regulator